MGELSIAATRRQAQSEPMKGYVYILASKKNGTLYTGVTSDPSRRCFEHQHETTPGFTLLTMPANEPGGCSGASIGDLGRAGA